MLRTLFHWLQRAANPAMSAVAIDGGVARLHRGRAPAAWVDDCGRIAADFGIERGLVECVRTARGPGLRFSPSIPRGSHQRFLNVFGLYRRTLG